MGLTGIYNDPVPEEIGIAVIKEAFNRGITFFDTSDVYGPFTNEILVGKVNVKFVWLYFLIDTYIYIYIYTYI